MDVAAVSQIIGSLGFPIVACVALFYQMNKDNEQRREEYQELQKAITNNTVALTELSVLLKGEKDG